VNPSALLLLFLASLSSQVTAAPCTKAEARCTFTCSSPGPSIEYPAEALRLGIESGSATVTFTLTADYKVANAAVVSSTHPVFSEAALLAAQKMQCTGPSRQNETQITIPFGFKLQEK
jgi:TonB family protein